MRRKIGKKILQMDSDHMLPAYMNLHCQYDRALPRIAKEINLIDGFLKVIDIGANIGDSVSLITDECSGEFMCIEGVDKYFNLLVNNVKNIKNASVTAINCFCGASSATENSCFLSIYDGTAKISRKRTTGAKISRKKIKTLDWLINNNQKFINSNLLKIDTDGFEVEVLSGAKAFIQKSKPVIFSEFNPIIYKEFGYDQLSIFKLLYKLGYNNGLFYDNNGNLLSIVNFNDHQTLNNLINIIDNTTIYYYDFLSFHSDNIQYQKLYTEELLSRIKAENMELTNQLVKYNKLHKQYKRQSIQLLSKIGENKRLSYSLITEKKKSSDLINAITLMQHTKMWKLAESLRRMKKFYLKNLFQTKITSKPSILNLGLKTNNKNSKKLVYVGHSYHSKTKSTQFLTNYLSKYFDVKILLDESWNGGLFPDLSFIDNSYLGVIFFQSIPSAETINTINNSNIIIIPMYDGSGELTDDYWFQYLGVKIINFSSTLNKRLFNLGFNVLNVQYFPKIKQDDSNFNKELNLSKLNCFFWQRVDSLNINTLTKVMDSTNNLHIHLHTPVDPGNKFIKPNAFMQKKYNITYSKWMRSKSTYLSEVSKCDIYFSPRITEGIGQSFLEAMSMGKIVIAPDNPTMNEYIKNNINGYLYNFDNPKPIDLRNILQVKQNLLKCIVDFRRNWLNDRKLIIDFIKE